MAKTISAHFDGKVIVPHEPVDMPVGHELRVTLALADTARPRFAELLRFEADLPDAPPDLATRHDAYLYGGSKT